MEMFQLKENRLFQDIERCIRTNDLQTLSQLCRDGFEETDSGTDEYGSNLYQKAITYGNIDALRMLVNYQVPHFNDGFFHAVMTKSPEMTRVFAEYLSQNRTIDTSYIFAKNPCYPQKMTPLMLAAEQKDLQVMKILLEHGHKFPDVDEIIQGLPENDYERAYFRVQWYRARCSDGMIVMTSEDPLAMTFELRYQLKNEYSFHPELDEQLDEIGANLGVLAKELLECAQTKEEATIMLEVGRKVPKGKKVRPNTCKHNRLPSAVAPRIKNGLSLEYKEFIGTRSGQEYINNLWYKSSIRWRKMKTPTFLLLTMAVCMSSPILCLLLLFIPFSGIKSDIISPYVRFLFHLTSDVFFIILLMSTILDLHMITDPGSVDLEGMSSAEKYYLFKSIPMTIPRRMITLWIIGITWRNISLVWRKGATRLLRNPWCIVDHLQICFYLAVIAGTYSANRLAIKEARIIATCEARLTKQESYFYESSSTTTQSISELFDFTLPTDFDGIFVAAPPVVGEGFGGPLFQSPSQGSDAIYHGGAHHMLLHYKNMTRFDWKATDPVFITEICFAVANILTFIRMINFCVILRFLGPLKISLEGMLVQNIKFLIIFSFVWISFAMGFSQLYRGFELLDQYQCKEDCSKLKAFQNIYYSMFTIFWGLFDLLDLSIFDIATKEMALQQIVGYLLYSAYSIIAVIIMLNALIAMMSNHYTRIEENAEVEWRFARADFMIDYMEYASDMPVPFNLISSLLDCVTATVKTIWRYTFGSFSKEQRRARQNTQSQECSCMEYYKKTISNIRIRFLQKRLILIEAEGRRAQQSTRLEEKLDSWRSDLSEIIRNTESIINKLQELPTTKRK